MSEGSAEEGCGDLKVIGGRMQEHFKEGDVWDEEEKTDDGVECKDFSGFSQQLLHVDPAPLGLRDSPWNLGQDDGGVEGVTKRDEKGAGRLPNAWKGSTSPAGKCCCCDGGEACEQEAGEQRSQFHLFL